MHLRKLLTLVLGLCSVMVLAQSLEVVSASGATFRNSSMIISYTIGECITSTHIASGAILTQGFHQTVVAKESRGVPVISKRTIEMSVFPNPVEDILILQVEEPQGFQYSLFDVKGRMILQGKVLSEHTEIHFASLQPAIYILRVFNKDEVLRIFQIVKH